MIKTGDSFVDLSRDIWNVNSVLNNHLVFFKLPSLSNKYCYGALADKIHSIIQGIKGSSITDFDVYHQGHRYCFWWETKKITVVLEGMLDRTYFLFLSTLNPRKLDDELSRAIIIGNKNHMQFLQSHSLVTNVNHFRLAIEHGNINVVKYLISQEVTLPPGLLTLAVLCKQHEIIELLLASGANINELYPEDVNSLRVLIEHGANVNAKDCSGRTLLHKVAQKGFKIIAELLIESGADVNAVDNDGDTALHHVIRHKKDSPIIELLLRAGADPNIYNKRDESPLFLAMMCYWHKNCEILLEYEFGLDLNSTDSKGNTILHSCGINVGSDDWRHLIWCGIDVNAVNLEGKTPLRAAGLHHELFLDAGANPGTASLNNLWQHLIERTMFEVYKRELC